MASLTDYLLVLSLILIELPISSLRSLVVSFSDLLGGVTIVTILVWAPLHSSSLFMSLLILKTSICCCSSSSCGILDIFL